jgi:hypothetical protein
MDSKFNQIQYDYWREELNKIMEYASEHPEFDTSFVSSLSHQLAIKKWLSTKQCRSLAKIIEGFNL